MADFPCLPPSGSAVSRFCVMLARCMSAVGLVLLPACAPELNWRTVEAQDAHGLKGLFPCKPDHIERKVPWPGVQAGVNMHMLTCQAQGRTWALSYFTLPDVTLVGPVLSQWPEMVAGNLRQSTASADGVRTHDLGPIQVPRMTPSDHAHAWYFEAQRRDEGGQATPFGIQTWHFFHGMTVFQASVSGASPTSDPQSSEDVAQAFFRGFQFPG